jgi:hypothetical protein
MGAPLADDAVEIKAWQPQPGRTGGARAQQKIYSAAGLTREQKVNIIVLQVAMDQFPPCVVVLWINKGISL